MAQDLWQAHYQIIVNNLSEGIHKIKCIYGHDDKKNVNLVELHTKYAAVFLNTQTLKMI